MAVTLHGKALYGTTLGGGGSAQCVGGCGAVFELTSNPTGDLPRETILHAFGDSADGIYPVGGLPSTGRETFMASPPSAERRVVAAWSTS